MCPESSRGTAKRLALGIKVTAVLSSGGKEGGEGRSSKILGDIFGPMPEILGRTRIGKILTFSSSEMVFGKSKLAGTILGRNIKSMSRRSLKA